MSDPPAHDLNDVSCIDRRSQLVDLSMQMSGYSTV